MEQLVQRTKFSACTDHRLLLDLVLNLDLRIPAKDLLRTFTKFSTYYVLLLLTSSNYSK
jgi:hypothetical protein